MRILVVLPLVFLLGACMSGNCRSQKVEGGDAKQLAAANAAMVNPTAHIKVFKYDGSQQCGMGKAISLSEMQKELAGIAVFSAENKADGLMHIQACGTPTGRANVYEIEKTQLDTAKKKSFREWTFE